MACRFGDVQCEVGNTIGIALQHRFQAPDKRRIGRKEDGQINRHVEIETCSSPGHAVLRRLFQCGAARKIAPLSGVIGV